MTQVFGTWPHSPLTAYLFKELSCDSIEISGQGWMISGLPPAGLNSVNLICMGPKCVSKQLPRSQMAFLVQSSRGSKDCEEDVGGFQKTARSFKIEAFQLT